MDTQCVIGLPQWQHPLWHADRPDGLKALQRYAQHFSSVEGNTSFYGAPKHDTLARWLDNTPEHFRFCFKVPRSISHDAPLTKGSCALIEFLQGLEFAQDRLGVIWLQLSDKLGPEQLPALRALLAELPEGFHYGLEVRHLDFFAKGDAERELNQLLMERQVNRVMFDTRTLFAQSAADLETLEAQRKKPRVPLHVIATGQYPMVRFISPLETEEADKAMQQWAVKIGEWVAEGKQPHIFFHTPNNDASPQLAARFGRILEHYIEGFEAPRAWPSVAKQDELF